MDILKIPLKNTRFVASGCHGSYYKTSPRIGIKLTQSKRSAITQARRLKDLQKTKLVPKLYGVYQVIFTDKKHNVEYNKGFGIRMQHINGEISHNKFFELQLDQKLPQLFKKYGYKYTDNHQGNVLFTKNNKFKVIDFASQYCKKI